MIQKKFVVVTSNKATDPEENQMPLVKFSPSLLLIASGDFVKTDRLYVLVPTGYENKHVIAVQNEHLS